MSDRCPPGKLCFSSDKTIFILIGACVVFAIYHFRNENKLKDLKKESRTLSINNKNNNNNYLVKVSRNMNNLDERLARLETKDKVNSISKTITVSESTPQPPIRENPYGINFPTNAKTRGEELGYHLIGVITNDDKSKVLQLYGKEVYKNSNKWNYYTMTDQYNPVTVAIKKDGDNCVDEYGCKEIYNGDNVTVSVYGDETFTATINKINYPKYVG